MVRLGTHLPFKQVPPLLSFFCRVSVSADTVRRVTERAGAAQVRLEDRALVELELDAPPSPAGPAVQQVSADGAMVPLVRGDWAEVRTVATGEMEQTGGEPHARDIAYSARLCDAKTFLRHATVPLHRAGTEQAGVVCAVMDGADWLQQFCDLLCPQAVRILDFPHAAEHLAAAHAVYGTGTAETSEWLGGQLHDLKQGRVDEVIAAVEALPTKTKEARETCREEAAYLRKRRAQMRYGEFVAAGYPIGSGMVESANKLVVEARLKGSGMSTPWRSGQRTNVNPMLGLRAATCSGTWDDTWGSNWVELRRHVRTRRQNRHPIPTAPALPPLHVRPSEPWPTLTASPYFEDGKPTSDYPWRRGGLPPSGAPAPNAKS
jgi:hypothetical protein